MVNFAHTVQIQFKYKTYCPCSVYFIFFNSHFNIRMLYHIDSDSYYSSKIKTTAQCQNVCKLILKNKLLANLSQYMQGMFIQIKPEKNL